MKTVLILLATVSCLLSGSDGRAHSVHVFAEAENNVIRGEGYLSGGKKVVNGTVQVFEKQTHQLLLTTRTDQQGRFSFSLEELNQDQPVDLLIVLDAGPGHRSQWELKSVQYDSAGQSAAAPSINHAPSATPPLINIVAGIACIIGIGGIISFFASRKRRSS